MDVLSLAKVIAGVQNVRFCALRICIPVHVFAVNCFFYYSRWIGIVDISFYRLLGAI